MKLEQGKLYYCPNWDLLVFPTLKDAKLQMASEGNARKSVIAPMHLRKRALNLSVSLWTKNLDCQVRFHMSPKPFMYLDQKKNKTEKDWEVLFVKGLFADCIGWIMPRSVSNFAEYKHDL